jgi:egghead protein (zeste-white 4 protein)
MKTCSSGRAQGKVFTWKYRRYLYVLGIVTFTAAAMAVELNWQAWAAKFTPECPSWFNSISRCFSVFWIITFPSALSLWLGWVLLSGRSRTGKALPPRGSNLVVRYVTRGFNADALAESVKSALNVAERNGVADRVKVQVVSDNWLDVPDGVDLVVVPDNYRPLNGSRFKARALAYLQQVRPLDRNDWALYLDEESRISDSALYGCFRFMAQNARKERAAIGQGPIVYTGGTAFMRGADAVRLGDDLGRFRLQYAIGRPLFGVHGSYILVRGDADSELSFDVGWDNSITEDTAWALKAWSKGYRFRWVDGYIFEQPPTTIKDLVKQRKRWLSGIKLVLRDRTIPLKYRLSLGIFTFLWQFSFLSLLLSVVALYCSITAPLPIRIMGDFSFTAYLMSYMIGNIVTGHLTGKRWSVFLTVFYPIYGCLEALATISAFRKPDGFYVIRKPAVTASERGIGA